MAGEISAFMDVFDAAYMVSTDLKTSLGSVIPLFMFTDSKKLLDSVTRGKRITEKQLMIYISAAHQSCNRYEIDAIGLVKGCNNPADCLSKIKGKGALQQLIVTSVDNSPIEQWIERKVMKSDIH